MFLKLVRNCTLRIVVCKIHDSVSFLGPLSVESLVTCRTLDNFVRRMTKFGVIKPSFKVVPLDIRGIGQGNRRCLNIVGCRIISLIPHTIHLVGNRERDLFPLCIKNPIFFNRCCVKNKQIFTSRFFVPASKLITIIGFRIGRGIRFLPFFYTYKINLGFTMTIVIIGHSIGDSLRPNCMKRDVIGCIGKHRKRIFFRGIFCQSPTRKIELDSVIVLIRERKFNIFNSNSLIFSKFNTLGNFLINKCTRRGTKGNRKNRIPNGIDLRYPRHTSQIGIRFGGIGIQRPSGKSTIGMGRRSYFGGRNNHALL